MDLDSQLPEQDFDYVDDDEDSNIDEDFLLGDDNESEGSHSHQDSNALSYERLSGFTDATLSDEPEDDEISLHPDDSLFDEEVEPTGSSERVRPRLVHLLNCKQHLTLKCFCHWRYPFKQLTTGIVIF